MKCLINHLDSKENKQVNSARSRPRDSSSKSKHKLSASKSSHMRTPKHAKSK